jgi:hypothetical protein
MVANRVEVRISRRVVFAESINRGQDIDLLNVISATLMGRTLNLLRYLRLMAGNAQFGLAARQSVPAQDSKTHERRLKSSG